MTLPQTTRYSGFTLVELMISMVILTLISTTTVFALRRTREKDELHTAVRLLASDIRNVQARALSARNILTCNTSPGPVENRVCEPENNSPVPCLDPCTNQPPPRFGISLATAQDSYTIFADVNTQDWRLTSDMEQLLLRNLNPLGGNKVIISVLETNLGFVSKTDLAVGRQNGTMRIDACGDPSLPVCAPSEPNTLEITLRHVISNETATIEVNALTGRVSIP